MPPVAIVPKPIAVPERRSTSLSLAAVMSATLPVELPARPSSDNPADCRNIASITLLVPIAVTPAEVTVMSPVSEWQAGAPDWPMTS